MSVSGPLKIINEGLVLSLDASNSKSYPRTGSTWYDLISGSNNAALTNGAYYTSSYPLFINFDGVNDYANFSSSVYPVSSLGFTVEVVGAIATGSNTNQRFVSKGCYRYSPGYFLGKFNSNDGKIKFACGIGSATSLTASAVYCYTSQSYSNSASYHLSFVSTGTYAYLYVDGEKSSLIKATGTVGIIENNTDVNYSSSASGLSVVSSDKFSVGSYINSNASIFDDYLGGRVSTVKVYNRALSYSEILINYNSLRSRYFRATRSSFTITPAYSGITDWNLTVDGPLVIATSGSWTITPTDGVYTKIKMWGGGGASYRNALTGGGGGFSSGSVQLESAVPYIIVTSMNGSNGISGSGGLTGIFSSSILHANSIMIAGGGGIGTDQSGNGDFSGNGGAGGGSSGQNGSTSTSWDTGKGGTQTSGGAPATRGFNFTTSGSALQVNGGDGGAGYYGGGSQNSQGSAAGGSGGGSGYIHPTKVVNGTTVTGASSTPANSSDSERAGAGQGSLGNTPGSMGIIIIRAA